MSYCFEVIVRNRKSSPRYIQGEQELVDNILETKSSHQTKGEKNILKKSKVKPSFGASSVLNDRDSVINDIITRQTMT